MVKITKEAMAELIENLNDLMKIPDITRNEHEILGGMLVGALHLYAAIDTEVGIGRFICQINNST